MERQVQIQQGGRRARTYGRALFRQRLIPSIIWAIASGAADGGILLGNLAVQDELGGGVIDGLLVSQEGHHALLQRAKAAFDFAFGLRGLGATRWVTPKAEKARWNSEQGSRSSARHH